LPLHRESQQRKLIYAALAGTDTHPTAATLYAWARARLPGLSLGTVYRNLAVLRDQGRVRELSGAGEQVRWDAAVRPHAHFYCRNCASVYDLPMAPETFRLPGRLAADGHEAESLEVQVRGVCSTCRIKARKRKSSRRKDS
jgi:Fe2+ or Zn2+ uptake regulation protein